MTLVLNTKSFTSVSDVYSMVGEETCAKWEKLGDMDSKIHWQYGAEAEAIISEGVPHMLAYKAIAKKAGKKSETIKQAYYTFIAFTPDERSRFDLCPYSVFRHARSYSNPLEVLQHYLDKRCEVDEVENIFPEVSGDNEFETEFIKTGFPRMFYMIYREIWGVNPQIKKKIISYLNVIKRIIDEANK